MGRDYWQQMMAVRTAVTREMENLRAAGELRGSRDAEVTLFADAELQAGLQALEDELRFVLITSAAQILPLADAPADAAVTEVPGLRLTVRVSEAEKCERCWHRREDVGQVEGHSTLCGRCVENVYGDGERRRFA